jgi:hypothetical protein
MLMPTAALKPIISRNIESMICDGFVIPNLLVYAHVHAFATTNLKRRMAMMAICIADYSYGFAFTNTAQV